MRERDIRGRFVKKFSSGGPTPDPNWGKVDEQYTWFDNLYTQKYLTPRTKNNGKEWDLTPNHYNSQPTNLLQSNSNQYNDNSWLSLNNAAKLNVEYTSNKANVTNDILNYANNFINSLSDDVKSVLTPQDFEHDYNSKAKSIRDFWLENHTYGENSERVNLHNTTFNELFKSRGQENTQGKIGFDTKQTFILGPSTWHRRMDRYETEFDITNPDLNRIHTITLNGKQYNFAKLANGDIKYLENSPIDLGNLSIGAGNKATDIIEQTGGGEDGSVTGTTTGLPVVAEQTGDEEDKSKISSTQNKPKFTWDKNKLANTLEAFRVFNGIKINNKIAQRAIDVEKPFLQDPIEHHRSIYGDLRSKMQGQEAAAQLNNAAYRPLTSDASLQTAQQLEAQSKGQQFIEQGNKADDLMMQQTAEQAWQQEKENVESRHQVAMANRQALLETQKNIANIKNVRDSGNWSLILSPMLMGWEQRLRTKYEQELASNNDYLSKTAQYRVLYDWDADLLGLNANEFELVKEWRDKGSDFIKEITTESTDPTKEEERKKKYSNWKSINSRLLQLVLKELYNSLGGAILGGSSVTRFDSLDPEVWTELNVPWRFSKYNKPDSFKSGGLIYRAKLNKRTKDNDRTAKSIEKSKELAAKFLELSIDALYTYPEKKKRKKRRYQAGGGLPLVNFSPVFATSEKSSPRDFEDSSSKSKSEDLTTKDVLQLLKDMDALPNDIDWVISKLSNFEIEMQLDPMGLTGTSGIASRYMSLISDIKKAKFNREEYDHARDILKSNGGLNELAVTAEGYFIGMNDKGEFSYFTPDQVNNKQYKENGFDLLTNLDLLYMRAQSPIAAFNHKLLNIAQGGIGMEVITKYINDIIQGLGKSKESVTGYSQTADRQIIQGVEYLQNAIKEIKNPEILQGLTIDGLYKNGYVNEDQAQLIELAMNYIYAALPQNAKSLLIVKGGSNNGAEAIIRSLVMSKTGYTTEFKTDLEKDPNSPSSSKVSKETGLFDKMKMDPVTMLQAGYGEKQTITIQTSNSGMHGLEVPTVRMPIVTKDGKSIGVTNLNEVAQSAFAGYLDFENASMGGVMINPMGMDKIAINGTALYTGYLPVDMQEFYMTRNIKPDIEMLGRYKQAQQEIKENNISDPSQINEIYSKYQLPIMFDPESGEVLGNYRKFGMINANALKTAFTEEVDLADYVSEVTDENEIQNTLSVLQKGRSKEDRIDFDSKSWLDSIFGTDYDRIYAGTVFIPVNEDYFTGVAATGNYPEVGLADKVEALQQAKEKQSTYINPGQLEE